MHQIKQIGNEEDKAPGTVFTLIVCVGVIEDERQECLVEFDLQNDLPVFSPIPETKYKEQQCCKSFTGPEHV